MSIQNSHPSTIDNQQHARIDDRPRSHVFHGIMATELVFMVIEEIIVINAMMRW